jgi:hypothetical protein
MKDSVVGKFLSNKKETVRQDLEPLTAVNWYRRTAEACEKVGDAILHEKSGISGRIVKTVTGKLGFVGTTAGMFSLASLLGTASTGTAIGSLSGIAFKSAALAWFGGSVVMGSLIIGIAATAGSVGALLGAGWVSKKYLWGAPRQKTELSLQEQRVLDTCLALAMAFREQEKLGHAMDAVSAQALYGDALKPLSEELLECRYRSQSWPIMARRKLIAAIDNFQDVVAFLYNWSENNPNIVTGIVSVVLIQLLADDIPNFNEKEQLVLSALRRSNNSLKEATESELAAYIKDMDPQQISGLANNVKGIYHELLFQQKANSSDDGFTVELFEAVNHPGSDVRIINSLTGEVKEVQLKATNYLDYLEKHNAKYSNIDIFATEEVAGLDETVSSTGFTNKDITGDVSGVFEGLSGYDDPEALESMSVAALVTLARNTKVFLRGASISQADKEKLVKDGVVSAGVAGILHLII